MFTLSYIDVTLAKLRAILQVLKAMESRFCAIISISLIHPPKMLPRLHQRVPPGENDHCSSDGTILYSFSLACSQLRPRSLCTRFSRGIRLFRANSALALCDYLFSGPHFRPFVRGITIEALEYFTTLPLLHILPSFS